MKFTELQNRHYGNLFWMFVGQTDSDSEAESLAADFASNLRTSIYNGNFPINDTSNYKPKIQPVLESAIPAMIDISLLQIGTNLKVNLQNILKASYCLVDLI